MTQENKTIQVANGKAEVGDRISNLRRWRSGHLFFDDGEDICIEYDEGDRQKIVEKEHEEILGYNIWAGNLIIQFAPDDALEAIEEQMEEDMMDSSLSGREKDLRLNVSYQIRKKIQQKRKGK